MTSHCRGENRMTSAPNREMSKREAAVAISSIAQQASPIGIGHNEFFRTQFKAASTLVKMILPSILLSWARASVSAINHRKRSRCVGQATEDHLACLREVGIGPAAAGAMPI